MAGLVALLAQGRTWDLHRRLVRHSGDTQAVVRRCLPSVVAESAAPEAHRILGAGHPWVPKACSEVKIAGRMLPTTEERVLNLRIHRREMRRMDRHP